jgi:hypothetical protein
MTPAHIESLHPRFRSKIGREPMFRKVIADIEGATPEKWFELKGQLQLLCRMKKPAVEAVVPRIRATIAKIEDKKLRDACLQLAGHYVAIIVRAELGGHNSGSKNRVSELFTRAEVYVDPAEPPKPRRPRGSFRKAHLAKDLNAAFLAALDASAPPPETTAFDDEVTGGR